MTGVPGQSVVLRVLFLKRLQVLNDLKTFCVSEKERYREMAYTDVKNVELFDKLDEDSNAMTYFQEAEIYVIRLIVLSRG